MAEPKLAMVPDHSTQLEHDTAGADIDRRPAFGYYNFAASYHVAADLIAEQGLRATHPQAPAASLYYHAIELYLKSVLRLHGVSEKKLQKIGPSLTSPDFLF